MLSILLSGWLALFPVTDAKEIEMMFYTKQQAVNHKNITTFLSTFYQDEHYRQEQKRWFSDAVSFIDRNSFQIKVKKYRLSSHDQYQVEIIQSYRRNKKQFVTTYPVVVRKTKQGWKDADSLGYERKQGNITIKYSDPTLLYQAERALTILSHVSGILGDKYLWQPHHIETKLYRDPEVFRQSVKLSLPAWAGGWNEAKQSIKLVVGESDVASLTHGLAHEYTHQLLSDLTNDNAAYWLQEGAAMYYESLITKEKPAIQKNFHPYTIHQLERMNLEQLPDAEASKYYISCYMQFKELIQQYGEQKIAKALRQLREFPYMDIDSAQKQKQTNQRTSRVLEENQILSKRSEDWKDAFLKKDNKKII